MFSTDELTGMMAMMGHSSIPNEHYGACRSAIAKIRNELDRRERESKLPPPASKGAQALMREIGKKTTAEIAGQRQRWRKKGKGEEE